MDHNSRRRGPGVGTLGYGPLGLFPGFQGFGLGYHLGYGYGGVRLWALAPKAAIPSTVVPAIRAVILRLWRIGGINPFPYNGGPGYPDTRPPQLLRNVRPTRGRPTGHQDRGRSRLSLRCRCVWPLYRRGARSRSSVRSIHGSGRCRCFYHEGITLQLASSSPEPAPGSQAWPVIVNAPLRPAREKTSVPRPVEALGIDEEPLADSGGVTGIRVSSVHPGTVAERAGLHSGDVIYSANGYLTTDPGNLAWIIATKAPGGTLSMNVRRAADRKGRGGEVTRIDLRAGK